MLQTQSQQAFDPVPRTPSEYIYINEGFVEPNKSQGVTENLGGAVDLVDPVERLLVTLPLCDTLDEFAALIENHPTEVVEEAIALADTAPRRRQLESWFQELSQKFASRGREFAQEGEAIANPDWKQKISTYAELLQDALRHGMEAFKALLERWAEEERWGAIFELEERSPDSMAKLMQIEPNWSDLCVAW